MIEAINKRELEREKDEVDTAKSYTVETVDRLQQTIGLMQKSFDRKMEKAKEDYLN